ncbi:MAG: hypothetical protein ACT4NY_34565 [Pseudonocardiales bacterium]
MTVTKAIASDSPGPDRFQGPINTLTKQVTTGLDALPESGLMEGRTGAELALLDSNVTGWTRAMLID